MTRLEILTAARALITDRRRWTAGVLARDRRGRCVDPTSATAVRWDAIGALCRVAPTDGEFRAARDLLERFSSAPSLSTLNDWHRHAAVLAVYDRAIVQAKADAR